MISFIVAAMADVDPYLLDLHGPERVQVGMGYTNLANGARASARTVAEAAKDAQFVFVGESHDSPAHHQAQADIIQALVDSGRSVTVGFEMFTRDNQSLLKPWNEMPGVEADFLSQIKWKEQWGMPFRLYRPIFQVARWNDLPLLALNIPRDWVRQISRQGPQTLTEEQKKWIPNLDTSNKNHRAVFEALIGGHPMEGDAMERMYAAQCAWDVAMANAAIDGLEADSRPDKVMVVVVGAGHMMYGEGINFRISQRKAGKSLNVVCIDLDEPREVSKGLGDFVFASPPPPR
ncbi:MAG: ChaN family lipoprotein [Fimbriimonadaceae bacterium]|nr:ChaN family lipoprotein [Fimbriimonadaceae bacterium]QYK56220.1 MAG: ChaN family lipoprotein [Fimbriimonadaceae bacterium]